MLWSFRDLDVTLGSLSHYARHLHVTLKPKILLHADDQRQYNKEYESLYRLVPSHLLIELKKMKPCERIGSGHFGVVYKAVLKRNASTQDVAVKTLKGALF